MAKSVYAVATLDSKGHELAFVAERLRAAGVSVTIVDVGVQCPPCVVPDVDAATVAGARSLGRGPRRGDGARRSVAGDHGDEPGARPLLEARA